MNLQANLQRFFQFVKRNITRKLMLRLVASFAFVLLVSYFSAPWLISYVVNKRIEQIAATKQIKIEVNNLRLVGLTGVRIESLYVIPLPKDTLLAIHRLNARLSLWQLLLFNADLQSVDVESINCCFVKNGNYCNYNFLFQSKQTENQSTENNKDYSRRVSTILNNLFRLLPSNLNINSLQISSENNQLTTIISAQNILVKDHTLSTSVRVEDNIGKQIWRVDGMLDKENKKLYGKISAQEHHKATIPYINQIYHTRISFNELIFDLKFDEQSRKEVLLTGRTSFQGLEVNHQRLSPEDIQLGDGGLDYRFRVGLDYAELDSASEVSLNNISFHPYLFAQKIENWHLIAQVDKSDFQAVDLLTSLPKGLFHSLENVKIEGRLSCHFLFDVDLSHPDSLKLESSLTKRGFLIKSFGELNKMNAPFLYTAFENDRPVRTFEIGSSNPSYRPLESISPLLRQAVLQSEDGQFFFHKGFRMDAMREALIHDIKVKRFARGGSTITMQLVKNVFLNRHKNIARKLEEALLVWLIEENRITSKERMFEIYLNIAEWGPMIYGISEASHFYFDKEPSQLTLNESIFLASIIPSPKRFASSFDASGKLKENRFWQFNRIAERLFHTGYISEVEKSTFVPTVVLTGVAKCSLTIANDSIDTSSELDVNGR